ncbi:MAG: ion transporter [Actinobacteria bacterium]|nr:ion transporter [Actinomycetota bacterium]
MRTVKAYGEILELPDHRIFWLSRIVYSSTFEITIAFVILLNAISLGLLTMPDISPNAKTTFETLDKYALYVYAGELVLRLISYGTKPWEFFRRSWNIFDFTIVALSPIFSGQIVILRLLRLLRLIRIFRFLPEVRVLTVSIIRSIPPLLSMGVLIFLALFIYGMAGVYMFGEQLPLHWSDISIALTTLFILLTLENFPVYLEEAAVVSPWALPFYLSYVFIIVFTVLNVLIGIVLNAMDEARSENRERIEKIRQLDEIVQEVDDITADGNVTQDEINHLREKLRELERQEARKQQ